MLAISLAALGLLGAAGLWAGPLAEPVSAPAWLQEIGLRHDGEGWIYERLHIRRDVLAVHRLTSDEVTAIDDYLAAISADAYEAALEKTVRSELARGRISPRDHLWFRKSGRFGQESRLSARGFQAVPGIVLGDPRGERLFSWPEPGDEELGNLLDGPRGRGGAGLLHGGRIPLDAARLELARYAELDGPAGGRAFDGAGLAAPLVLGLSGASEESGLVVTAAISVPGSRPGPIRLQIGTEPYALPQARTMNSVYHLYSWSADELMELLFPEPRGPGAFTARVLRLPVDALLAGAASWWQHESGHMYTGLMHGAKSTGFAPANGTSLTGLSVKTSGDPGEFTPEEILDREAAGMFGTQAAARDLSRTIFSERSVPYSSIPLLLAYKADLSGYVLFANPRPDRVKPDEQGFDTTDWIEGYAAESGRSPRGLHRDLKEGHLLNIADPTLGAGVVLYIVERIALGRSELTRPALPLGPVEVGAGTSFFPSRNGPWRVGDLYVREPESGFLMALSYADGDLGQWAAGADAGIDITDRVRLEGYGVLWSQRRHAAPVDRDWGGGGGGRVIVRRLLGPLGFEVEGGYKSKGTWLGRPFDEGPFLDGGLRGDF